MKKNNLNLTSITFLFLITLVWSCSKDIDVFTPYPDISKIQEYPTNCAATPHDIVGEVIDEAGKPVENATITVGGTVTQTDKHGTFRFQAVNAKYQHVYIKAERNGYFDGSRVIVTNPKQQNYVNIMLLEKKKISSFNSSTGSLVQVGKASIAFPRNGYKDANGKAYKGEVVVSARYLDPSKAETYHQMPGDLRGLNKKGEPVCLGTYGMVACELSDNQGNLLQLNGDSTATISYPITQTFQQNPPNEVPLWYFNERLGTWVEEGNSERYGNTYVGKVKHFSFWNCDYPFPSVFFQTSFKDSNGNPINGLTVALCFSDSSKVNQGYGYTDASGQVSGVIPINVSLVMKVFVGDCPTPIYTKNIGAFSADVTLPPIVLDLNSINAETSTITGKLQDCDGTALKKAYLLYTVQLVTGEIFNEGIVFGDIDGNVTTTLIRTVCTGSAAIDKITYQLIDSEHLKESNEKMQSLQVGANNLGIITACNQLSQFIQVDDNSAAYTLVLVNSVNNKTEFYISASDSTATGSNYFAFSISTNNPTIGTAYTCTLNADISLGGVLSVVNNAPPIPVVFTEVANVQGEYYAGTFNDGTTPVIVTDAINQQHVYKGSFRFKRTW